MVYETHRLDDIVVDDHTDGDGHTDSAWCALHVSTQPVKDCLHVRGVLVDERVTVDDGRAGKETIPIIYE